MCCGAKSSFTIGGQSAPPPRVLQTARPVIDSSIAARLKRGGGLRYVTTREKRNQAARQAPQLYGL